MNDFEFKCFNLTMIKKTIDLKDCGGIPALDAEIERLKRLYINEVINDSVGQWLIHSKFNDHYIGLHGNLEMGYGLNSTGPFFIKVGGHQVNLTDFVSR